MPRYWNIFFIVAVALILIAGLALQASSGGLPAGRSQPTPPVGNERNPPAPAWLSALSGSRYYADVIDYSMGQLDYARFQQAMSDLVKMAPRRNDFSAPYIDDACTLSATPNPEGKTNLAVAMHYVSDLFKSYGYTITREPVDKDHGSNLIATRTGSLYPEQIVEIGGHIDTMLHSDGTGTPGASDNASAVASLLEIARVLQDYQPRHTLRFVVFVGEEEGLAGSKQHVANIQEHGDAVQLALVMDSTAWSETAPEHMNCLWANPQQPATERLAESFDAVRLRYNLPIVWRHCDGGDGGLSSFGVSDHIPYWAADIPAVLSIGGIPYRDPDYHSCSDTLANTDVMNAFLTMQENLGVLLLYDSN
jgi:hypothetical protein